MRAFDKCFGRGRIPGGTRRAGQIPPLTALALSAILVIGGLMLDGGRLYFTKRRMQDAADAGAFGAAHELFRGNNDLATQLRPAALNDTGANGFNDSNATVTVSYPPVDGPRAGNARFVQIEIEQQITTTLTRVAGTNYSTVRVRSIAGLSIYPDVCIMAMDPTEPAALKIHGTPSISADCGIMSNSNAPDGLVRNGAADVSASWVGVSGGYVDNGSSGSMTPTPDEQVPPLLDPLGHMDPPDYSTWPAAYYDAATLTYVCPGAQCVFGSHLQIAGPPGNKTFQAGTYVLTDGMTIISSNVVTAIGVTFYVAGGTVTQAGSSVLTLEAPTSGPYKGIVLYFERTAATALHKLGRGTATLTFRGAIYGPTQDLSVTGTFSGATPWGMIIGRTLDFGGTSNLTMSQPPEGEAPDVFKVTLVE